MKILQSKYYTPRKILTSDGNNSPYPIELVDDVKRYNSKYNPFESLLDDLFPGIYVGDAEMVILKEKLKDFERCTDFNTVAYSQKTIGFTNVKPVFFTQNMRFFY